MQPTKNTNAEQLERFIKEKVDQYLGIDGTYKVKDIDTPNADAQGERLSFSVEIRYRKPDH